MRTICMYFQIHQPFRLRRYRFFDIGNEHYYYDDYSNESILRKVSDTSYLPANRVLLKTIKEHGDKFRVAFSISGTALDQFELYAPDVLESFKELAATGQVEFLCETDAHSLASLINRDEFERQVTNHKLKINRIFGQIPVVFRNTELIYSDLIGSDIADMGFEAMITEGAKQILGWKSPDYLYCNSLNPRLKLLLRNFKLSDDISFRFSNRNWSEFPLTTEKFARWLNAIDKSRENINLFVDYQTFGSRQSVDSGIFDFLRFLPSTIFKMTEFNFWTPSQVARMHQPVAPVSVQYPISWADEERDITSWLGNDLQNEAFTKLYNLRDWVLQCPDPKIQIDWKYLQNSDHFHYMSTKFFSDRPILSYVNPFESPYDAFINYMNVLSDFTIRVKNTSGLNSYNKKVDDLLKVIEEKDKIIDEYKLELAKERTNETITENKKPSTSKKKQTSSKLPEKKNP